MSKVYDIAVVGALSPVGETFISLLQERDFPVGELYPLASKRAGAERVEFRGRYLPVRDWSDFDFSRADVAFFAASAAVSAEFAPRAAAAGCVVIDRTPQFRDQRDIPLVVPEVNADALKDFRARNIIAMPSCATIALSVTLKRIQQSAGLERVDMVTLQAVSGAGKDGVEELAAQTTALLNMNTIKTRIFPQQIAFNLIPLVGERMPDGRTREEAKIVDETRRVLGEDDLPIHVTAVRVPVFFAHSAAVHLQTRAPLPLAAAREVLAHAPGVRLLDEGGAADEPTPVTDAAGEDAVFVGRLRQDVSRERGLSLWWVTDNLRKGAALNGVQIAEILVKDLLI